MMLLVELKEFNDDSLFQIYKLGFSEKDPEWKKWDGPYFEDDYQSYDSFDRFKASSDYRFFMNDRRRCILYNQTPIGMISYYWEDQKTKWLNIGITIYNPEYWSGGIGTQAIKLWIDYIFNKYSDLQHIGLVTWSGNERMMKAALKVGMKEEARIRKVRYYQGVYFDSVSYGIIRDEWKLK